MMSSSANTHQVHCLQAGKHAIVPDSDRTSLLIKNAKAQLTSSASYGEIYRTARSIHSVDHGLGILDTLLTIPGLTDIMVNGHGEIFTDSSSGIRRETITLGGADKIRQFALLLAHRCGVRLDEAQPLADGVITLNTQISVRFNAVLPPLAVDGVCISLRILRATPGTLATALSRGTLTPGLYNFLLQAIEDHKNIIISGATGSGKTTLLQSFMNTIPATERIISLEDSPELPISHPHHVRLVSKKANAEGVGNISLCTLVQQSLRMRPDRIFIGEIRGAEVKDFLHSFNTGHQGGGATIHANSATAIPSRLIALGGLAGQSKESMELLLASIEFIAIHLEKLHGGERKVTQIALIHQGIVTPIEVEKQ